MFTMTLAIAQHTTTHVSKHKLNHNISYLVLNVHIFGTLIGSNNLPMLFCLFDLSVFKEKIEIT